MAKGAAWAAPVVAVGAAAPAFAASPCPVATYQWSRFTNGTIPTPVTVAGTLVTVATVVSSGVVDTSNGTVQNTTLGGVSGPLYYLQFNNTTNVAPRQTVTFTFAPAVQSLAVTFVDIDAFSTTYVDNVTVNPTGFQAVNQGSVVSGSGAPFTGTGSAANNSASGNVTVVYSRPLTSFSFDYFGKTNNSSVQLMGVPNFTFRPTVC